VSHSCSVKSFLPVISFSLVIVFQRYVRRAKAVRIIRVG
jgi:hypothetical protein